MTMKHNPNLKKIFVIFLFLLINLSLVYATLSDPRLISGSDYSIILNKTYKDSTYLYYDVGGNENGGIGIYSSDISEVCQSGYTAGPFPPAGCTNPYYLCAAIKVGSSYKAISDCLTVSPTGGWASGAKSAYADVDFNNAKYPGQIWTVISTDNSVSSGDSFYYVDALQNKGWLKGNAPGSIPNSLHSYTISSEVNNTEKTIWINVTSAYDHSGSLITHSQSNYILVGISTSNEWNDSSSFLDDTETSKGIPVTLNYSSHTGDLYIFVNGILEGNTTIEEEGVPRLTLDLVTPSGNVNVTEKEFFEFTAQINCLDKDCGDVNASLDPISPEIVEDEGFWNSFIDFFVSIGNAITGMVAGNLVPTNPAATPWYTNSSNPADNNDFSCLGNMQAGDSCNVTWYVNASGSPGNKSVFFAFANMTSNMSISNETAHINITIIAAEDDYPYWSDNETDIQSIFSDSTESIFNITWADDISVSSVWFESNHSGNPQNYSMNLISGDNTDGVYNYSAMLPAGTYYWKSYANDSSDQWNKSDTWIFTIAQASTGLTLDIDPLWQVTNGTQTNVSCYADNDEVNVTLYRNDTGLVGSSIGGTVWDNQTLGIGDYLYTCNTTGSQNYSTQSVVEVLNVTAKPASSCSLTFNPVSPQDYGTGVTASCSCTNPGALLYRNGVDVNATENGILTTLAAQNHTYVCNLSETPTYQGATNTSNYTINKANPDASLTSNLGWTVTYPATATIGYSESNNGDSDVTYLIYNDSASIGSGHNITPDVGTYNYVLNTTGGQNYTSNSSIDAQTLTVQQNTSNTCTLSSSNGWNYDYGNSTTLTCSCEGDGTTHLYIDDVQSDAYNNSATVFAADPAGYDVVCNITSGTNYGSASDSDTLIISQVNTTVSLNAQPATWNAISGTPTNVSCSADNAVVNVTLYRNDTGLVGSSIGGTAWDNQTLVDGSYLYTCNTTGNQNYTGDSDSNVLTIAAKPASSCSLTFNPVSPQDYGTGVTASCSCTNPGALLYRNGVDVNATENGVSTTLAAQNHTYVCNLSETPTYQGATNTSNYTINKANPDASLTSNLGWTVTYPATATIGYSESNNGDSDVTYLIYNDSASIGSGHTITPDVGTYNYVLNTTGGQNYTSNSSIDAQTLTVQQNTSNTCTLSSSNGWNYAYGASTTLTCSCEGDGTTHLYIDDVQSDAYNNSATVFAANPAGYDVVCNITSGTNYGSASDSDNLVISRSATTLNLSTNTSSWRVLNGTSTNVTCSADNSEVNITLYRNDTGFLGSSFDQYSDIQTLDVGIYQYTCNNSESQNYSSDSESNILEVSLCGNNITDTGEECDLTNLDNKTCTTEGFDGGTLSCYAPGSSNECTFDTSSCTTKTVTPSGGGGGGGGGAYAGGYCIQDWECSEWTACRPSGMQFRECWDSNDCIAKQYRGEIGRVSFVDKPETERVCSYSGTCNDDIVNQDETDIDCGGSCPRCGDGKRCSKDDDCINSCIDGICGVIVIEPTCNDGILNQDETDIDCGGSCPPCIQEPIQLGLFGSFIVYFIERYIPIGMQMAYNSVDYLESSLPVIGTVAKAFGSLITYIFKGIWSGIAAAASWSIDIMPSVGKVIVNVLSLIWPWILALAAISALGYGLYYGYENFNRTQIYRDIVGYKRSLELALKRKREAKLAAEKAKLKHIKDIQKAKFKEDRSKLKEKYFIALDKYMSKAISSGYNSRTITNQLIEKGWPKEFVTNYVKSYFKANQPEIKEIRKELREETKKKALEKELKKLNKDLGQLK